MKTNHFLLALALAPLSLAAPAAGAVDLLRHGAPNVPANRIVGLWSTQAATRPCGSNLPLSPLRNTILFHAGGTVLANSRFPLAGIPNVAGVPGINQRGQDLGTWSYNPVTHQYTLKLQFDWYVDGLYHGYQTVNRTILLSNDGQQASGPVRSTRFSAAGAVIADVCGEALSTRL